MKVFFLCIPGSAYDSPQTPAGSVRIIQAVCWKSLEKGPLISRNGYICRWMGTLSDDEGNLSAVVISTINGKLGYSLLVVCSFKL